MNNQDHIKLAYCRFKASQEEGMLKEADGLSAIGKTFGKAFGNRFIDSVKGGVRDLVLPFQLFKKDKGAFMDSIKKDDYLHQAGGSLLRPRATNMGESGMRFDRFANLDDDAYNAISSAQPKMWGKMRNPFQSGDSHWYAGLDDAGKSALSKYRTRARRGVGGDIAPERLNYARSKFLRNTVGKEMNDANPAVFKDYYKKYGQPGDGGWFAQEAGRRAGTVAGGLGAYAAITNMPVSGAEWAGGLSAVPGARARGIEGANQGAADQMHKFRNKGFMDRMGDAFNPNRVVQDLYSPENIGKSGIAHHYMYGPGKQEQVKGPGIMGYARELALPFFSGSALDQSVQSNGLRQFQKMGNIVNKGRRVVGGKILSKVEQALNKTRILPRTSITATPNLAASKVDDFVGAAPATPASGAGHFPLARIPGEVPTSGARSSAPGLWDDIKERVGGAWDIAKEHPWHTGGAALAAPALVGSFFGGRHSVSDGAYNAGYGAGSAGAAQMYSDQNPFARFGAAAFPDMAMNRVMQQYPDLMAAYQRAGSRRGQPAGSRSNYDANNAQR